MANYKFSGFGKTGIGHLGGYKQTTIVGLDEVLQKLNIEITGIKNRSAAGLIEAAALIRRSTEDESPVTPVDTGNLRASWFTVASDGVVEDPLGYSGHFVKNPNTGVKARALKSNHSATIAAARAGVNAVKKGPAVIMGYSANYALFVHEMELTHPATNWSREGSGGKWLEAAFKRNKDKIIDTVRKNAKVK